MKSKKSSFMENTRRIRVEGFRINRLLNQCLEKGIRLRTVEIKNDLEVIITIEGQDFRKLREITKNSYKITVIRERGYKPFFKMLRRRKAAVAGILICVAIVCYQSLFIAEIQIDGYRRLTEESLRRTLAEAGLYEGCRRAKDSEEIKKHIYDTIDKVVWVGIVYKGRLAKVTVVEDDGSRMKKVGSKKPCNIVAARDGYIHEIIPRNGLRCVKDGTYVKKGDIIIKGTIPIESTAYGTPDEKKKRRYVHAKGEVRAKVPCRYVFYSERYELVKKKTGRSIWGIEIGIGDKSVNTAKEFTRYKASQITYRTVLDIQKPLPLKLALVKIEEIRPQKREMSKEKIKKRAEMEIRKISRENYAKSTEILNKSLKFSTEKNIIKTHVLVETLQEIGEEQEIVVGKSKRKSDRNEN